MEFAVRIRTKCWFKNNKLKFSCHYRKECELIDRITHVTDGNIRLRKDQKLNSEASLCWNEPQLTPYNLIFLNDY